MLCVGFPGCFGPESEGLLNLAGVHYRWGEGDNITLVLSVVNTGQSTIEDWENGASTFILEPRITYGKGLPVEYRVYEPWPPGKHQTFAFPLEANPLPNSSTFYRILVALSATGRTEGADLWTECFDRAGNALGLHSHDTEDPLHGARDCGATYDVGAKAYWYPANHRKWNARLLACCDWLPPPFDVYDLECMTTTASANLRFSCGFEAWHWHRNDQHNATAEVRVYQTDTPLGAGEKLVATQTVSLSEGPFEAMEKRRGDVELEVPAAIIAQNASRSFRIEAFVWPDDHEDRAANATTTIILGAA